MCKKPGFKSKYVDEATIMYRTGHRWKKVLEYVIKQLKLSSKSRGKQLVVKVITLKQTYHNCPINPKYGLWSYCQHHYEELNLKMIPVDS